jgi:hypothetical protein
MDGGAFRMAMKPRCPKGMGVVLWRPVAIVFALDPATISQFPSRRNEKSDGRQPPGVVFSYLGQFAMSSCATAAPVR